VNAPPMTIGLLYAGEMGAALGTPLRERGYAVVSTAAGRTPRTVERCERAGFVLLDQLADVVRVSDIILSVVPPSAAEEMADAYASAAHSSPARAIFVDCNSIGPERAVAMARKMARAGRGFVDASVHGQARSLKTSATLYLSGERAAEIAELFYGSSLRTRLLGLKAGDASAMKMLLGGLSKGMCALFLELAALATRRQMQDELLKESKHFYPGIVSAVERMLPTYPQHAARRIGEMGELERTAAESGQSPCMIDATRRVIESLASIGFGSSTDAADWDITALATHLYANGFLSNEPSSVEHASPVV
jgi:3-hydroxyisobutyrate dehydrogenase-like beta-hydroxyacid dehydrogenase